jgi:hypothetical protein
VKRRKDKSSRLFNELAGYFGALHPGRSRTVCCPLCLREFTLETIHGLSVEHIVASKLGGQSITLTCRRCNNAHGTKLDSHLVGAMKAMDSIEGTGPIRATMPNANGNVVADILLPVSANKTPITLNVIGKASSPAGIEDLRNHLSDGFVLNLHITFSFVPERYWRAAIRSAYLAVFSTEGFKYAFSEGGGRVRDVLNGNAAARMNVVMEAFPEQVPPGDVLVMPHSFPDAGECFAVLLRLRSNRTRYLVVFLPGESGCDWDMLGSLYEHAPHLRIETTPNEWDSRLVINLGYDPVSELRKGGRILRRLSGS